MPLINDQGIHISIPKRRPIAAWLRRTAPALFERWTVLRWQIKDRWYAHGQKGLFAGLQGIAAVPSHIEIETINRCNNTCGFCPVNRYDDPRPMARMSEALFHKILDDLAALDYRGTVNLFSNNEPFVDKRIFEFTEQARRKLPHAFLQIISNGIVLDPEKAERILEPLSRMVINNYSTDDALLPNVRAVVDHIKTTRPDLAAKLTVGMRRLDEFKTNRGGNAPNRKVRDPIYHSGCAYPFFQMVIRPDGKVSLCCNDALAQNTLGDVSQAPLLEAWNTEDRRRFQTGMMQDRASLAACQHCDNLGWSKPSRLRKALQSGNFTGEA